VGLICLLLYVALGITVSSTPPHGIDLAASALIGPGAPLALWFTESYMLPALLAIAVFVGIVAWRVSRWRRRALFSIALTLIAWRISDLGKLYFHRPRPTHWLLLHETSFSYASGHAMDVIIISGLWAAFVWKSDLPRGVRLALTPLLAAWGIGVLWSRLALGAHYPSDLLGGVLLGAGLLAIGSIRGC
jgi:undecaprenyl-diphosphatase